MAKRVRGTTSRPGQRARLQRSGSTARPATGPTSTAAPQEATAVAPRPSGLTADEEARAAALEAQIVAEEQAAEDNAKRGRERTRRPSTERAAGSGSIAQAASQEYAYVARDVRRIVLIGGSLIGALIALWVVVAATGIGPF